MNGVVFGCDVARAASYCDCIGAVGVFGLIDVESRELPESLLRLCDCASSENAGLCWSVGEWKVFWNAFGGCPDIAACAAKVAFVIGSSAADEDGMTMFPLSSCHIDY